MPDPFDLCGIRPPPLVPKDCVLPITERMRADGSVATPLERDSVIRAVQQAKALGVEGIIVALINAYRNPQHELQAKTIIQDQAPFSWLFDIGIGEGACFGGQPRIDLGRHMDAAMGNTDQKRSRPRMK